MIAGIEIAQLLEAGVHGLLVIILIAGWYERREMRKDIFDLVKLVMVAHPEAVHVVSTSVKRRLKKINNIAPE